jgi:hypothetical protein
MNTNPKVENGGCKQFRVVMAAKLAGYGFTLGVCAGIRWAVLSNEEEFLLFRVIDLWVETLSFS